MNLLAYYGQSEPGNTTVNHMSQSLLIAFNPDSRITSIIKQQQQQDDIEKAVQNWLLSLLVKPDQNMGELLMPMITLRFQEYLEKIGGEAKCMQ